MRAAGVKLVEVGATNKTTIADYANAITDRTRLLLRVHPSNFHISGFTAKPTLAELTSLKIPLYEDLGSGALADLKPYGINEPLVQDSLRAGVDIVTFSGDKLLGGPQAGYIAGRADLVTKIRRNPMFRALRLDKLVMQAMEQTLRALLFEDLNAIPTLRMIRATPQELETRANAFAAQWTGATVIAGESVVGGGSTPDQTLPAFLVAIGGPAHKIERKLRSRRIVARVENGQLLIDLRTVAPEEESVILAALHEP